MAELIKPVNYREIARMQQAQIRTLNDRLDGLKSIIIAMFLLIITISVAFVWAVRDFKSKPVTVLLENQVTELNKLPLPPLEELKGE